MTLSYFIKIGTVILHNTFLIAHIAVNLPDESRFSTSVYNSVAQLLMYNIHKYSLGATILLKPIIHFVLYTGQVLGRLNDKLFRMSMFLDPFFNYMYIFVQNTREISPSINKYHILLSPEPQCTTPLSKWRCKTNNFYNITLILHYCWEKTIARSGDI